MRYSVRKRQDNISEDKPVRYYPYPKHLGKISLMQLSKDIALASSLTRGDVENVILNLVDVMSNYLEEGWKVELGELCLLYMSFSAEGSDKEEDATHHKIKKTKFVFQPRSGLRRMMKDVRFRKM